MRRSLSVLALPLTLAALGCAEGEPMMSIPVVEQAAAADFAANGKNAGVPLAGDQEVPARSTNARGTAVFHVSRSASALEYKLIVANIDNVVQAHIHRGPAGENGPVVAFLFGPVAPGGGASNGVIATGSIGAGDLLGPLAGGSLDDLLAEMAAGNAYVNVHTSDGVPGSNTGPGDFASGEVRGQIH